MISINECLRDDTGIYLIRDEPWKSCRKHFFSRSDEPRIFVKNFNHAEFIGETLCNMKNIKCVHYFVAGVGLKKENRIVNYSDIKGKGYDIKIASSDFKDSEHTYFSINCRTNLEPFNGLELVLGLCPSEDNKNELTEEIIKMFALDVFMGQQDRYFNNMIFSSDVMGNIHLANLYDFEISLKSTYIDSDFIYKNDLHTFKDIDSFKDFMHKYPRLREELESYLDIDLVDTAIFSYDLRNLNFPEHIAKYLKDFEDDRKILIKQIIKNE